MVLVAPTSILIQPMDYSVDIAGNDTEAELKNISCTAFQGRPEPSVNFYLGKNFRRLSHKFKANNKTISICRR